MPRGCHGAAGLLLAAVNSFFMAASYGGRIRTGGRFREVVTFTPSQQSAALSCAGLSARKKLKNIKIYTDFENLFFKNCELGAAPSLWTLGGFAHCFFLPTVSDIIQWGRREFLVKRASRTKSFAPNYIIRTFMVPIQLSLFHHQFSLIHVEQMNELFFFLIVCNIKMKKVWGNWASIVTIIIILKKKKTHPFLLRLLNWRH